MCESDQGKLVFNQTFFFFFEKDELVPPSHMTQLFDMWSKRRSVNDESSKSSSLLLKSISKFVAFPGGTHNDTCMQPRYFDEISDFLAAVE